MQTKLHACEPKIFQWRPYLLFAVLINSLVPFGLAAAAGDLAQAPAPNDPNIAATGQGWRFPNPELIDHEGKKVRFYDDLVKGKIVLINFMFTSCGAYCPMETARIRRVQRLLGDRMGKDIFFYSISVDPVVDTPERLQAYRKRFDVGPGWTFLTGDIAGITALRQGFGLYDPASEKEATNHSIDMMVGNEKTGQWMRRSSMDKAEVVAKLLSENLSEWKYTEGVTSDFAQAPLSVKKLPRGEELYQTRCIDCHTIGGGDGLGPDLAGVTKIRDRAWLHAWIMTPDKLLEAKDPIATALLARFNNLVMPNLKLSSEEVDEVIEFLRINNVSYNGRTAGRGKRQ